MSEDAVSISPPELDYLLESLVEYYGYDFREYANASFYRRTTRFMSLYGIQSIAVLTQLLAEDKVFFEKFLQEITVNVTSLFRDPEFYNALKKKTMHRLAAYPYLKIWVAGCATGEEAYSMAILLSELDLYERSIIYATDINNQYLKWAKEGRCSMLKIKEYTKNYEKAEGKKALSDYYALTPSGQFEIDPDLKKNIVFTNHNLVTDKSFNEFNLILCRNVMIYFKRSLQNKVINLFYESLCDFGYLALGTKESIFLSDRKINFEEIDKKERIFRKKP